MSHPPRSRRSLSASACLLVSGDSQPVMTRRTLEIHRSHRSRVEAPTALRTRQTAPLRRFDRSVTRLFDWLLMSERSTSRVPAREDREARRVAPRAKGASPPIGNEALARAISELPAAPAGRGLTGDRAMLSQRLARASVSQRQLARCKIKTAQGDFKVKNYSPHEDATGDAQKKCGVNIEGPAWQLHRPQRSRPAVNRARCRAGARTASRRPGALDHRRRRGGDARGRRRLSGLRSRRLPSRVQARRELARRGGPSHPGRAYRAPASLARAASRSTAVVTPGQSRELIQPHEQGIVPLTSLAAE